MGEDGDMTEPDKRQHLDEQVAYAREKGRRALPVALFALLGLAAMYLPLPQRFVAFVPLLISLVLTLRLLRFLTSRPGREKAWPIISLAIVSMLLTTLVMQILLYGPVSAYESCIDNAQTALARADCQQLRESGPLGLVDR